MGRVEKFLQSDELDPENVQNSDIPGKSNILRLNLISLCSHIAY